MILSSEMSEPVLIKVFILLNESKKYVSTGLDDLILMKTFFLKKRKFGVDREGVSFIKPNKIIVQSV